MKPARGDVLAQRKAMLRSRAEFERVRLSAGLYDLRTLLAPAPVTGSGGRSRTIASVLLAIGLPLLGRFRLARLLRTGSLALAAWRVVRGWRSGQR